MPKTDTPDIPFEPLGNRILIKKPLPPEPKSAAGILLSAESAPEPENVGEVLAVGERVDEIKVGDMVIFPTYGFTEVTEDDTDYLIIDAPDCLARKKK